MRDIINANEIIETIRSSADRLEEFSLSFLILFGSVARGENSWWSDIDLVINTKNKPKNRIQYQLDLTGVLDELLKTEKIQVSLWDDLPPHIKFRILRDGKNVLIHDDKEFQRIRERTLIEYWDHNIWYEKMLDMSLKNMDVST